MEDKFSEEMFKPAKKGGFDKEDVKHQFQILREASVIEKGKLKEKIDAKDKEIAGLKAKVKELEAEIVKLNKDIKEKYQSYIDNYDTIGQIIYDTKIQSRKTAEEAEAEKARILKEAEEEKAAIIAGANTEAAAITENAKRNAEAEVARAKREVEEELSEGKAQYAAIREKTDGIMVKLNSIQKELMSTFKAIHEISASEGKSSFRSDIDDSIPYGNESEVVEVRNGLIEEYEDRTTDGTEGFGEVIREEFSMDIPEDFDMEDTHEIDFTTLSEELEKLSRDEDEDTDN